MIASRIIQAMGAGILVQLVQIIILKLYPIESRGAAMGITSILIAIGLVGIILYVKDGGLKEKITCLT
ncbi:hypothetical protein LGK95_03700 [Clostridium algoriphilum]|uniref:hypothetical protein n=1 Tax=Clostridium algoriphilum TaxID=198347 RepID=UPI001CF3865C|nr:hypothetical protein [Clostridium algoriphilum]MCB2292640.1 hypothetical protein [Clostridium algoriphilum]